MKIGLDTNVLVDLLTDKSSRHERTRRSFQEYVAAGAEWVIAEHALLETFSVLSRTPRAFGLSPRETAEALQGSFGQAVIAPFRPGIAWEAIRHTLDRGYWGGRVYDAVIAMSVFDAGARLLLTWDVQDMLTVAPVGLEIRPPRAR